MYRWCWSSAVCYVYLSDVAVPNHIINQHGKFLSETKWLWSFKASQWFTRGWTLQELLAPQNLIFVDQSWEKLGTARDLNKVIKEVTGVDVKSFTRDPTELRSFRVARCMSWAANRQTTRIEDHAYSLLGLFNVNLPMMYGERERAFQRLQEEIIKVAGDASILAWSYIDTDIRFSPNGLAISPAHFRKYPELVREMGAISPFATLDSMMRQQGFYATLRIRRDPNDSALGYAVLTDQEGQFPRKPKSKSLVLPLLFSEINSPPSSDTATKCGSFSDPLWVSSSFVE